MLLLKTRVPLALGEKKWLNDRKSTLYLRWQGNRYPMVSRRGHGRGLCANEFGDVTSPGGDCDRWEEIIRQPCFAVSPGFSHPAESHRIIHYPALLSDCHKQAMGWNFFASFSPPRWLYFEYNESFAWHLFSLGNRSRNKILICICLFIWHLVPWNIISTWGKIHMWLHRRIFHLRCDLVTENILS